MLLIHPGDQALHVSDGSSCFEDNDDEDDRQLYQRQPELYSSPPFSKSILSSEHFERGISSFSLPPHLLAIASSSPTAGVTTFSPVIKTYSSFSSAEKAPVVLSPQSLHSTLALPFLSSSSASGPSSATNLSDPELAQTQSGNKQELEIMGSNGNGAHPSYGERSYSRWLPQENQREQYQQQRRRSSLTPGGRLDGFAQQVESHYDRPPVDLHSYHAQGPGPDQYPGYPPRQPALYSERPGRRLSPRYYSSDNGNPSLFPNTQRFAPQHRRSDESYLLPQQREGNAQEGPSHGYQQQGNDSYTSLMLQRHKPPLQYSHGYTRMQNSPELLEGQSEGGSRGSSQGQKHHRQVPSTASTNSSSCSGPSGTSSSDGLPLLPLYIMPSLKDKNSSVEQLEKEGKDGRTSRNSQKSSSSGNGSTTHTSSSRSHEKIGDSLSGPSQEELEVQEKDSEPLAGQPARRQGLRCRISNCPRLAVKQGVCVRHGAEVKRCSVAGCTKQTKSKGVCIAHGAKVKVYRCTHPSGCNKYAVRKGVCVSHGAITRVNRPFCSVDGCAEPAIQVVPGEGAEQLSQAGRGLCAGHAASIQPCLKSGCNNNALKSGLCRAHSARVTRCREAGCEKYAVQGGLCIAHGAILKRCSAEGCQNRVVKGGVCRAHGAYRRCKEEGCSRYAKVLGLCLAHCSSPSPSDSPALVHTPPAKERGGRRQPFCQADRGTDGGGAYAAPVIDPRWADRVQPALQARDMSSPSSSSHRTSPSSVASAASLLAEQSERYSVDMDEQKCNRRRNSSQSFSLSSPALSYSSSKQSSAGVEDEEEDLMAVSE